MIAEHRLGKQDADNTGCVITGTTLAERMLTRYHTVWGEDIAHAYEADFQY